MIRWAVAAGRCRADVRRWIDPSLRIPEFYRHVFLRVFFSRSERTFVMRRTLYDTDTTVFGTPVLLMGMYCLFTTDVRCVPLVYLHVTSN